MKLLPVLFCLLLPAFAHAERINVPIQKQGWSVQFESPALQELEPPPGSFKDFAYMGNAGRLNISLFVDPPSCANGKNNDARYACFIAETKKLPYPVQSIKRTDRANGVQVEYSVDANMGGRRVVAKTVHLLFMHKGKQGVLHASMVKPEPSDDQTLLAIIESFKVVDN